MNCKIKEEFDRNGRYHGIPLETSLYSIDKYGIKQNGHVIGSHKTMIIDLDNIMLSKSARKKYRNSRNYLKMYKIDLNNNNIMKFISSFISVQKTNGINTTDIDYYYTIIKRLINNINIYCITYNNEIVSEIAIIHDNNYSMYWMGYFKRIKYNIGYFAFINIINDLKTNGIEILDMGGLSYDINNVDSFKLGFVGKIKENYIKFIPKNILGYAILAYLLLIKKVFKK